MTSEDIAKLSDEEANVLVAEIEGYKYCGSDSTTKWYLSPKDAYMLEGRTIPGIAAEIDARRRTLPSYCSDLNAARQAISVFDPTLDELSFCDGKYIEFAKNLCAITGYDENERVMFAWPIIKASPRQLMEAFLLTKKTK